MKQQQLLQLQMKLVLGDYMKVATSCRRHDSFYRGGCKLGDRDFIGEKIEKNFCLMGGIIPYN